jgi:hypothetical protein
MDDEGPSPNTGAARLIVLLCAFGLATVGAFMAFFGTEILAALWNNNKRPSTGVLVLCALAPMLTAVLAVMGSIRSRNQAKVLAIGCGTLILGAMVTILVVIAVAI